jgi:hypothetical protein
MLQCGAGSAQSPLDGAFRHSRFRGDLCDAPAVKVEGLEQAGWSIAEAREAPLDRGGRGLHVVALAFEHAIERRWIHARGAHTAVVIEQEIAGDGLEPWEGRARGPSAAALREEAHVRFLRHILGEFAGAACATGDKSVDRSDGLAIDRDEVGACGVGVVGVQGLPPSRRAEQQSGTL